MEKKLNDVLDDSIRQVRELVDANTSVGAPIALGDGITLVPISKISVGLASGGGSRLVIRFWDSLISPQE